jgi:hypothetical protein
MMTTIAICWFLDKSFPPLPTSETSLSRVVRLRLQSSVFKVSQLRKKLCNCRISLRQGRPYGQVSLPLHLIRVFDG